MADNAAQSIKNLQQDLNALDKKIESTIGAFEKYNANIASLFEAARQEGIVSTDQLVDYVVKKLSSISIKKLATPFEDLFGLNDQKAADEAVKYTEEKNKKQLEIERAYNEREMQLSEEREKQELQAAQAYAKERENLLKLEAKKREDIEKAWAQYEKQQAASSTDLNALGNLAATKGLTGNLAALKDNSELKRYAEERKKLARETAAEEAKQSKAIQQQIQYYRQLHTLYKGYKDLQAKPNKNKEDIAILEQTKQKILEILRLSKQLELENKGSRQAGINATSFQRLADNLRNATRETKTLKANINNLLPSLQRLASAFGVAFSVRGLAQFGKKLIETRGEFELQQVALRSILQNKQLADEIWDKTMQAALQSPFTAMQLTKYTKQLAAYRIETDKLFDTTKRLADVSAGLGVDMQRLILAYGQVKAANYLRASEIRQFTEAGVNVLGELRDYFNDVKGMSVDTAKVMEMVTKRLVTFEDVEAIFKRMTDQGGIFYEMQYVQSHTVRGQIAKLHDAYDQMLNSIGQANEGALKNMVSLLNSIVKNWQEFKTVIDLIAWPLIILSLHKFALGLIAVDAAAIKASTSMSRLTVAGARTQLMFKRLFAAIAAHPFIALGAAVAAVGVALLNHAKHVRDINKRYEDLMLRTYETKKNLDGLSDTLKNNLETMKEATKGSNEYNEASRQNENIVKKLKDQYPELLQDTDLQKDGYEKLIEKIKEYNDELENQIRLEYAARAGFWQDDLTTNIADLQETQREREMQFLRNREKAENNYLELKAKGKEAEEDEWDARIRNAKTWKEQYDILIEFARTQGARSSGYELPIGLSAIWGRDVETRTKDLEKNIENEALVFNDIIRDQLKTINEDLGDDIQQFIKDNEAQINELFKDKEGAGWKNLNKQITKFFTAKGATSKETRKVIQDFLNKYLLVPIQLDWGGSDTTETATKELADWQKRVNQAIDKASSDFNKKRAELSEDAKKNMLEIEVYKIKDPLKTLEDAQSEILKKLKEVRAKIASYEVKGQVAIDNAEYQALKLTERELEQVSILYGAVEKVTGGGGHKENASKLISLIKEMRSEYDKLSKSAYGYAKSEEKVREAYADSVKAILEKAGVTKDYDFTTNEGMIAALKKVLDYANKLGPEAAAEVLKYIAQLKTEIEINAQVKIRKDFGKEIEKMFSNYDLTIDLEKLNVPTDELVGIFNLDVTTLDKLRRFVDDFYYAQKSIGADPTDLVEQVEGYYKKIDEMEKKELRERLKKYSQYLADGQTEALKIHLEELKKMAELDELYEKGYFTDTQYKDISNKIRKETDEKLAKNDWQQFKESDFYVTMFEDMSRVSSASIDIMIKRLKSLRKSVNDLDPKQAKEIVKAIEKLEKTKIERSPFKSFLDDWKTAAKWRKNNDNLVKQLGFYASGEEYWSKEQDKQAQKVAELRLEYEELVKNGTPEDAANVKKRLDFEEEELSRINEILEDRRQKLDQINQEQNEGFAAQQRVLAGLAQGAQYFSDLASTAGTISTEIMDMFDGVSDASKKLAKDIAEIAANVGILAADIVKAIASEGTDVSAMIDGLVRTWNIIKGILSTNEYEINKIIEESTNALKDLEAQLNRVTKARERAWDTQAYTFAQKELERNIQEQIRAYDAMIAAEEERKNKDKEQIRTWKQEREELFEQYDDERENLLKEFGGLGESEYKSAAEGFVDAWKSAFLETGDGLQGLQEHFDEFLNDWFVKQATMRYAAAALEPAFKMIDDAVDPNGAGGANVLMQELENIKEWARVNFPQISDTLEEISRPFIGEGEGSLSGLAAGIQGMTEEQANILEAYWNSVRGYTASIDMNVARIVSDNVETNPMLRQLSLIAANTQATHQLLQSVTKSGHSQGGYGIKVFAD